MKKMTFTVLAAALVLAGSVVKIVAQEIDMHNPVGVTGIFNGNIETGCSYDPLSHSAHRAIDDIVVSGSIGKYPLKMTRYYNSRKRGIYGLGPGWSHEYNWTISPDASVINYPNGNALDKYCQTPVGVSEYLDANGDFRLADGGIVHFAGNPLAAQYIKDPYGNTTTIDYPNANTIIVTEPGGRYLKFIYSGGLLRTVEAYDGVPNHPRIDWVNYSYDQVDPGNGQLQWCLTGVTYSDSTTACYTYTQDNVQVRYRVLSLLRTASDKRYKGAMRQIAFDYEAGGAHGAISAERFSAGAALVSRIDPAATLCTSLICQMETEFTETRGDGPTRTFSYTRCNWHTRPGEPECPFSDPDPPSQFLKSYTDFQGHKTWIGYDPLKWYVTSVTDARGAYEGDPSHTTTYERGPAPPTGIGQITKITHPGGAHIDYSYTGTNGGPWYVMTITDERGNKTIHARDTKHRVTQSDYKDSNNVLLARETFSYCDQIDPQCSDNPLGQIKTHKLKNGAYVHYKYDTRGLLTDKWEPTWTSTAVEGEPKTHYDYYTSGPWTDRVKTMTGPPPNWAYTDGPASETYEYDKNIAGSPEPGRGLVTKITYADPVDGPYRSFGYDAFGNKVWEENELHNRTSYTYDEYNRLLSVTKPLNGITNYTYNPTNGAGSRLSHTTNNPDTVKVRTSATTPDLVTKNVYDENFRKTSTTSAFGTPKTATTWFHYDNVGNQDYVTDPRGSGSGDPQYTTTTDYDNRNRKWHVWDARGHRTVFGYDDTNNIIRIDRPDGGWETKTYDGLNQILDYTVLKSTGVTILTQFRYYAYNVRSASLLWKVTDGETHNTTFEYDPSGLKTKMTYHDNSYRTWAYDDAHNLKSRTAVGGEIQNFAYDNRHRKTGEWWDGFPADGEWRVFDYDDAGHLTLATNGTGNPWTNFIADVRRSYDDAGRLTGDQQTVYVNGVPNAKSVIYPTHDDDGRLTRMYVNGVAGYDYTFGYDDMRRLEFIFPTGNQNALFQYSYDNASNETQHFNWQNRIAQNYTPDNLNRIDRVELKNTTTNTILGYEDYDYDPSSRLASVTREDNKQDRFTYYKNGELNVATYGAAPTPPPAPSPTPTPPQGGQVQTPTFSPDGGTSPEHSIDVFIQTATSGAKIMYTVNDPLPPSRSHGTRINASSGWVTLSLGHPTLRAMAYDPNNILTDSGVHSADYEYDGGEGPMAPETDGIIPYPLDTAGGRFSQGPMAPAVSTVTYNLDKAGNRLSVNGANYSPNTINQYTSVGGSPVTNGNDHEIQVYGGFTFTYMRDQELTKVTATGLTYDVAYDALGRCVKRTANGDPTYYIYDGDKPILEYRSNGQIARNLYGKGVDEILMRTDPAVNGGQAFYFQQDHEGSVTHLTNWNNGSGQIIERYRYDVFGAPIIYAPNWTQRTTSSYNNRFLFTGREYAGAWVYEYRARIYHSYLGRFMSEDPKGFDAGDYNLFRYCHNDPIDFTDPMGTDPPVAYSPQQMSELIAATRELLGLSSTYMRAAQSAMEGVMGAMSNTQGLTMGQVSQSQQGLYTYSLKPQYKVGDLSGARGYQYVWDSDPNCSGQCMTTVQYLSGAPSSRTPLLRGDPVGSNTKQGTAIATGFRYVDGQWIYPSKPPVDFKAGERVNHAGFYVARTHSGYMQTLEAQRGLPLHLERSQPLAGWYEIKSRVPPNATSTSQLRPWDGPIPW